MTEWAQLKAGHWSLHPGIQRGQWYPVAARTSYGLVRVIGPGPVGVSLHRDAVRVRDDDPQAVTRVGTADVSREWPRTLVPGSAHWGVCPQGHRIGPIGTRDHFVACTECGRPYPVEDER